MPRISEIEGRKIFDADSQYLGTASDIMIDPEQGTIRFLIKDNVKSILGAPKERARAFIKKNFIAFERVKAIGKVIILE